MKKRTAIIALAQIRYFDTAKKHNLEKIKKYIRLAKKKKADIICFPESCIHKTDYLQFSHKLIREIRDECRKNEIWCIVADTFAVKRKHYKIALLIDRRGKIRGKYKKINLYNDYASRGKKIFVFKTDFAKIGIALCWDLTSAKLFHRMKEKNVEIVFCPAKWCYESRAYDSEHNKKERALLKSMVQARAFENLFFVALVNPVMNRKDLVSYSAVASPHKILKEIFDKEGLIVARINLNEIRKFRKIYPKKS